MRVFEYALAHAHAHAHAGALACRAISFFGRIAAAALLYEYYEKPFLRMKSRFAVVAGRPD